MAWLPISSSTLPIPFLPSRIYHDEARVPKPDCSPFYKTRHRLRSTCARFVYIWIVLGLIGSPPSSISEFFLECSNSQSESRRTPSMRPALRSDVFLWVTVSSVTMVSDPGIRGVSYRANRICMRPSRATLSTMSPGFVADVGPVSPLIYSSD